MHRKRLDRPAGGARAGSPETVAVSAAGGSPALRRAPRVRVTNAADGHAERRPHRDGWVTVAAAFLLLEGALGILYAPLLVGGDLRSFATVGIVIVGIAILSIAAGIGLLRLHAWARFAAGALAVFSLVFMYAPALAASVSHGAFLGFDALGVAGFVVVLFAVVRRWPADRGR
jgi:hypothetical protein